MFLLRRPDRITISTKRPIRVWPTHSQAPWGFWILLLIGLLLASLAFLGDYSSTGKSPAGVGAAMASSPMQTPAPDWILLATMPPTASQADAGAEIYRLVCRDCHGDRGQGLTAEWRATWDPQDQNCWKSKCHASNHPPEGFELPTFVPAVTGPNSLSQFKTALDLYHYIQANMPWYSPGSLRPDRAWQVTAYLIRENKIDPSQQPLNEQSAASFFLHPDSSSAALQATPVAPNLPDTSGEGGMAQAGSSPAFLYILLASAILLATLLFLIRFRSRGD